MDKSHEVNIENFVVYIGKMDARNISSIAQKICKAYNKIFIEVTVNSNFIIITSDVSSVINAFILNIIFMLRTVTAQVT